VAASTRLALSELEPGLRTNRRIGWSRSFDAGAQMPGAGQRTRTARRATDWTRVYVQLGTLARSLLSTALDHRLVGRGEVFVVLSRGHAERCGSVVEMKPFFLQERGGGFLAGAQ
jgi:hypothetical protein